MPLGCLTGPQRPAPLTWIAEDELLFRDSVLDQLDTTVTHAVDVSAGSGGSTCSTVNTLRSRKDQ